MSNRKQIALNKLFNFFICVGILFSLMSYVFFKDGELGVGIGSSVIAFLFIVLPVVLMPCCYIFDSDGVSLRYIFLPVERYLWADVTSIKVENDSGGRTSIFDLFFSSVFCIYGTNLGKHRFYMKGHIQKSIRTKHLLEKYWDGNITGYFFEDVKNWFVKRTVISRTECMLILD